MDAQGVSELRIECQAGRQRGKVRLTARASDQAIYTDTINIGRADQRAAFRDALRERCPGLRAEQIDQELEGIAAQASSEGNAGPPGNQATSLVSLVTGDESVILFHTPSGCDADAYATILVDTVTRPDLLDRCVNIRCPVIPEDRRQGEDELWSRFERERPGILGALLDAVSAALRNLPSVQLPSRPRMADFAVWVTAAERALPWPSGEFMRAFAANRAEANTFAVEASAVAVAIVAMLREDGAFEGTAGELLWSPGAPTSAGEARPTGPPRPRRWPMNCGESHKTCGPPALSSPRPTGRPARRSAASSLWYPRTNGPHGPHRPSTQRRQPLGALPIPSRRTLRVFRRTVWVAHSPPSRSSIPASLTRPGHRRPVRTVRTMVRQRCKFRRHARKNRTWA